MRTTLLAQCVSLLLTTSAQAAPPAGPLEPAQRFQFNLQRNVEPGVKYVVDGRRMVIESFTASCVTSESLDALRLLLYVGPTGSSFIAMFDAASFAGEGKWWNVAPTPLLLFSDPSPSTDGPTHRLELFPNNSLGQCTAVISGHYEPL